MGGGVGEDTLAFRRAFEGCAHAWGALVCVCERERVRGGGVGGGGGGSNIS